jgi:carbamoyl-phosphate synthase large subunit
LGEVLRKEEPDAVLVGTDVELPLLAAHREEIEEEFRTRVVVSRPEVVAIANDKWLTYQFLKDNGFDHPRSCLPGHEAGLIDEVGFPLLVKPRVGARSVGVCVVQNRVDLQRALEEQPAAIVQECVGTAADEYTAGALSFDGRCVASIVMRRELRDGNTYRAWVDHYPELNRVVRALADRLRPDGPANIQFRLDNGRVRVFEINARFSGTTPLRGLAGFNEVELVLRRLLLGETVAQPEVRPLIILRHWSETVVEPSELLAPTEAQLATP